MKASVLHVLQQDINISIDELQLTTIATNTKQKLLSESFCFKATLMACLLQNLRNSFYPKLALNGSLLKYSGACRLASPGAFGGVDSSCSAISLSNSIRST